MDFIENLFVDSEIDNIDDIIFTLKKGMPVYNIYLITINNNNINTANIISSQMYVKKGNKDKIIGIGLGKYSSRRLFVDILQYWLEEGNDLDKFKEMIVEE